VSSYQISERLLQLQFRQPSGKAKAGLFVGKAKSVSISKAITTEEMCPVTIQALTSLVDDAVMTIRVVGVKCNVCVNNEQEQIICIIPYCCMPLVAPRGAGKGTNRFCNVGCPGTSGPASRNIPVGATTLSLYGLHFSVQLPYHSQPSAHSEMTKSRIFGCRGRCPSAAGWPEERSPPGCSICQLWGSARKGRRSSQKERQPTL
jgi:hypothetical protein